VRPGFSPPPPTTARGTLAAHQPRTSTPRSSTGTRTAAGQRPARDSRTYEVLDLVVALPGPRKRHPPDSRAAPSTCQGPVEHLGTKLGCRRRGPVPGCGRAARPRTPPTRYAAEHPRSAAPGARIAVVQTRAVARLAGASRIAHTRSPRGRLARIEERPGTGKIRDEPGPPVRVALRPFGLLLGLRGGEDDLPACGCGGEPRAPPGRPRE